MAATRIVSSSAVASTWMVQVAPGPKLAPLVQHSGWQAYHERDYAGAMAAFGDPGVPTARVHAELAALYRMTSLAQARALLQTYGGDQRREGDPLEVDYLLGVAHVIVGDFEAARGLFGRNTSSLVADLAAADAAWVKRVVLPDPRALGTDAALYPLPPVEEGGLPDAPGAPYFEIPMGDTTLKAADPTVLVQLSQWHAAAAEKAGGASVANALLDPWRWPGEVLGTPGAGGSESVEARFLSGWTTAGDLHLVRALAGSDGLDLQGLQTLLDELRDGSPYAAVLSKCVKAPSFEVECVLRRAADLPGQLEEAMELAAGSASADHREFAAHSGFGALRVAVRAAEAVSDPQMAGLLRLNALDAGVGSVFEPLFTMNMAAWDAGNRNPHRAKELFHGLASRAPGLDGARYALDALYLRVSRDVGVGVPMH
jgi:hypothetical protein